MLNHIRAIVNPASALTPLQRETHAHIIGNPGTGKTRALEHWSMQDIVAGRGVGVIDPADGFFSQVELQLAQRPELAHKVILLNPCSHDWVVSINPLQAFQGLSKERVSLFMTDIVVKIWKVETSEAPRMVWLMTNTFLALAHLGLSLGDLPKFLTERKWRESLVAKLASEEVRMFFLRHFPTSDDAAQVWITPVLNRLSALTFDSDIKLMLSGKRSLNFREVLDTGKIVLVNLPKGIIGEAMSALIAALIVALFQKAALSRADSDEGDRAPYYLYLDEFQNYTTDNIKDILAETRKYRLSLTMAHQYLDQLSSDLRSAVLNTAGNVVCFRVGHGDAVQLAPYVFPNSSFAARTERSLAIERLRSFSFLRVDERRTPMGWDGLAQMLTNQPNRQFWARRKGPSNPVQLRTHDVMHLHPTDELLAQVEALRKQSGERYGMAKAAARKAAAQSAQTDPKPTVTPFAD